ncbi:MAG: cell surface protein SprA [Saprospiraceae bacterium]|nr:cell surface protein SprA [Candidatus Vicinibacter affinis]
MLLAGGKELPEPLQVGKEMYSDTIPLKDRTGSFTDSDTKNPFDLKDPKVIEQSIEYDPATGQYRVIEKVGNDHYRPSSYLTFEQYMDFKSKQQDKEYMRSLAGISSGKRNLSGLVDPVSKIDIKRNLVDRLFGGLGIQIEPRGNIDMTVGGFYNFTDIPNIPIRQRWQAGPDFDMDIQMEVAGNIGDKLKLNTNYNTQSSFDFENKLKLEYDSEKFSEDDIIKKIEAGNVSLPLRSTLIKGSQNLFGFKTDWQFGHLRLTGLVSQQRSRQENIKTKGGGVVQEFQIRPDNYDENRHFFLSHYNRENYEVSLSNLPEVNSQFRIKDIEVWLTEDGQNSRETNVRDIIALADLGTPDGLPFDMSTNQQARFLPGKAVPRDLHGKPLPSNTSNQLLEQILALPGSRDLNEVVRVLSDPNGLNLLQGRDFEKIRAKRLTPNEFTFNPDLGFISLRVRPRPNQVLAVAYHYTYNGKDMDPRTQTQLKVGEFSAEVKSDSLNYKVMFVKMLKSSNQVTFLPSFDLMMKNVYPIGGFNLNQEDFKFDIFYESQDGAQRRFIEEIDGYPLLNLFQLDNLNRTNDPQPDGIFDWVNGQTIIPSSGSVIFPVLEPFGLSFKNLLSKLEFLKNDPAKIEAIYKKYAYPQLYDTSVTSARQNLQSNQFILRGSYRAGKSNEIPLNTFGSDPNAKIIVRAGSLVLTEGIDYTVDRSLGKVTILNESLLQSNTNISVDFENNALFNFNTRTMLGFRAEYSKSKDVYIGTTFMKLFERPFTQKVNLGEDPINNNIYGLDFGITKPAPWITRTLDKLPLYSTKDPSRWSLQGEAALLQPGYSRAINQDGSEGGVVYIDDFEGSSTGIGLYFNTTQWILATPPTSNFVDGNLGGNNVYNNFYTSSNRALLSWYRIDDFARVGAPDAASTYSRLVDELEIFPQRQRPVGFATELTFDLTYYPYEKGPYNYELPEGIKSGDSTFMTQGLNADNTLRRPETRWAGIMSKLNTNDFELANVEYIDFWLLNPFLPKANGSKVSNSGKLFFQLGTFSEDILKDGKQQFEHGLPTPNLNLPTDNSIFGKISRKPPVTNTFEVRDRETQDLGLDGLNSINPIQTQTERSHFNDYLERMRNFLDPQAFNQIQRDPSNDDYLSYRDNSFPNGTTVLEKYKRFNMPEGNSQIDLGNQQSTAYTATPDMEDLNFDKSLNEIESYYSYEVPINNVNNSLGRNPFITDSVIVSKPSGNETWYRFRIPITRWNYKAGQISDYRSIQSMRLLMTGFDEQITFRLIKFQLGRNTWRRNFDKACTNDIPEKPLILDKIDIEENSSKRPFNYVLPKGIQRERFFSTQFADLFQNETSLLLRKEIFPPRCEQSVFRVIDLDIRRYKRLKMFCHTESSMNLQKGDVSVFIRLGKDFTQNYYEYEIPARISPQGNISFIKDQDTIWLKENEFDFPLQALIDLKNKRNLNNIPYSTLFSMPDPDKPQNTIKIVGNPNIGLVRGIQIGFRNNTDTLISDYEVWVNELRLTGLENRGGFATLARGEVQLADLGNLSLAGSYTSLAWGGIDQRLAERSLEKIQQYDATTTLELGKFLPKKANIVIPFSAQYSQGTKTPEFDPNDLDVKLDDKFDQALNKQQRDSIKERAIDYTRVTGFAFNNVRKNRSGGGKPKPWNIENFSLSYGQSTTFKRNPIVAEDKENIKRGGLDYNFSLTPKYIEPLKKIVTNKSLKFISDINFNFIPNSFAVRNNLDRRYSNRVYRFAAPQYATWENVKFIWLRDYNLNWDLTRSIKLNFSAQNEATVDEITYNPLRQSYVDPLSNELVSRAEKKPFLYKSLGNFGRTRDYKHSLGLSYTLPTRLIPILDWIQVRGQYNSTFNWASGSIRTIDTLGSVISNSQSVSLSGEFNLVSLYNKSKYLRAINGENTSTGKKKPTPSKVPKPKNLDNENKKDVKKKDKESERNSSRIPTLAEKILIRPLMSVRRVQFNYSENNSTIIPGFMQSPELLGMDKSLAAPGWKFVAGLKPDLKPGGYLDQIASKGWITDNRYFNREMIQRHATTTGAKVRLEIFKNFNIDLNIDRNFTRDYTETFKFDSVLGSNNQLAFQHFTPFENGQFTISYVSFQSMFTKDINKLFNSFSDMRKIMSRRVGEQYGITQRSTVNPDYIDGFLGDHQDVVLPAFLATYSHANPEKSNLDIFKTIPLPNWQINYSGLSRLEGMKNIFQDFSIRHAYKNTLTMNNYRTNLDYRENVLEVPIRRKGDTIIASYYAQYEIPEISINESFGPLIGINIKTKNGIELGFDLNKTRNLQLKNGIEGQLEERNSTNYTFKAGYVIKNVYLSFIPGAKKMQKKSSKKKKKGEDPKEATANKPKGNDLVISVDFGIRDNISKLFRLDENIEAQAFEGSKQINFTPSVQYNVNKSLNLRLFVDYSKSVPYVQNSYKSVRINGGLTVQFLLN